MEQFAKMFEFFAYWIQQIVDMVTHLGDWFERTFGEKTDDTTDDTTI